LGASCVHGLDYIDEVLMGFIRGRARRKETSDVPFSILIMEYGIMTLAMKRNAWTIRTLAAPIPLLAASQLLAGTPDDSKASTSKADLISVAAPRACVWIAGERWEFSPAEDRKSIRSTVFGPEGERHFCVSPKSPVSSIVSVTASADQSADTLKIGLGLANTSSLITVPRTKAFDSASVALLGGDSIMLTLVSVERGKGSPDKLEIHNFVNHCLRISEVIHSEHYAATASQPIARVRGRKGDITN
jgi:hypothetical protein